MSFLALLALLGSPASADDTPRYSSEVVDLLFTDRFDAFEAIEFDTGSLPSGSPLAVRFYLKSRGGSYAEFLSESHLTWPDALSQQLWGVPGTGWLDVRCDLEIAALVTFDLWGYRGSYDVWYERLRLQRDLSFDPELLPDGSPRSVEVVADGDGLIRPFRVDVPLVAGLALRFEAEVFPRIRGSLAGRSYETSGRELVRTGQTLRHDVPEQDPGVLELSTTFHADAGAGLDVVIQPTMEVCAPILGCFRVARFDVPIPLVNASLPRALGPLPYEHPLPALQAPVTVHDYGEVLVATLANLQLPLTNIGRLPLEGTITVEGDDSFSVFPNYFYATAGNTDGAVVTFDPTSVGLHTATLVVESNDPRQPVLRIPLAGIGYEPIDPDLDAPRLSGEVGCGCATASPIQAGWAIGLALMLVGLRRRR